MDVCFVLAVLLAILSYSSCSGVFDHVLDSVVRCQKICSNTFPLHTYPKAEDFKICQRGCRLFSIVEFVHKENDLNKTKEACFGACKEAYKNRESMETCNIGCKGQIPYTEDKLEEEINEKPHIHVLRPLVYIRGIYSNMVNRISNHISVSWSRSIYMQSDKNGIVIVQSGPVMIFSEKKDYKTPHYLESNIDASDNAATPNLRISQLEWSGKQEFDKNDWLGCISKKTGMPRMLISFTVFLSTLTMLWLCCTTSVKTPNKSEKIHIISLGNLKDFEQKLPLLKFQEGNDETEPEKINLATV